MRDELGELLTALEREMRSQERWDALSPGPQALQSTQPFAFDTLEFDQWLQWVFLPKLRQLLAMQLPLPQSCAISPMAEEVYGADDPAGRRLIVIIARIDALLSEEGNPHN
jgi:uncharacterized protein YqcC (DUF446 family)